MKRKKKLPPEESLVASCALREHEGTKLPSSSLHFEDLLISREQNLCSSTTHPLLLALHHLKRFYSHFFIFHPTYRVCFKVKEKKKSAECSTSTKRPTQNLLKVRKEAALVILDLANECFLWEPGDKISPVNEICLK